jgi:hypothetical protein
LPESLQSKIIRNEVLIRTDYPNVRYWHRSDWSQREGAQPSSNINLKLRCLQDQHGVVVNSTRLREMRIVAKIIWSRFESDGNAPETWGVVDESLASEYHREMCLRFQEFALCDHNWKSQLLATETYPYWSITRPTKVKSQINTSSNDASPQVSVSCTHTDDRSKLKFLYR